MLKESFAQYGIDVPNGRAGELDVPCPECSPTRKKKKDPCLSVNTDEGTWFCRRLIPMRGRGFVTIADGLAA
jgi:twinkle protein